MRLPPTLKGDVAVEKLRVILEKPGDDTFGA
jgi:hypothetical protein